MNPLSFNAYSSATIRFFGNVAEVGLHYANAKTPMIKMVCPKSIDQKNHCLVCKNQQPAERNIAIGWDCEEEQWCFYMAPFHVFSKIFAKCKGIGVTPESMMAGDGPDITLQRAGNKIEIMADSKTIGEERGDGKVPIIEDVLEEIATESYWDLYTIKEIEEKYPKQIKQDNSLLQEVESKVIHLKDAPSNWAMNPTYVYIGRSGKNTSSVFGNPFKISAKMSREKCLEKYEEYLKRRLAEEPEFREKVKGLKNKILICFCVPLACHGEILIKYCKELNNAV